MARTHQEDFPLLSVVDFPQTETSTNDTLCSHGCSNKSESEARAQQQVEDLPDNSISEEIHVIIAAWEACLKNQNKVVDGEDTAACLDLDSSDDTIFEPIRRLRSSDPPTRFQRSPKRNVITRPRMIPSAAGTAALILKK